MTLTLRGYFFLNKHVLIQFKTRVFINTNSLFYLPCSLDFKVHNYTYKTLIVLKKPFFLICCSKHTNLQLLKSLNVYALRKKSLLRFKVLTDV